MGSWRKVDAPSGYPVRDKITCIGAYRLETSLFPLRGERWRLRDRHPTVWGATCTYWGTIRSGDCCSQRPQGSWVREHESESLCMASERTEIRVGVAHGGFFKAGSTSSRLDLNAGTHMKKHRTWRDKMSAFRVGGDLLPKSRSPEAVRKPSDRQSLA
jgi:hypothetical protein